MTEQVVPDVVCKTVFKITVLHKPDCDPINCFFEDLAAEVKRSNALVQKEVLEETVTVEGTDAVTKLATRSGFEYESLVDLTEQS